MSEGKRTPLETVAAFESAAFRVGQVARRIIAEHPDLAVQDLFLKTTATGHGYESATVEITPDHDGLDGVHRWAEALGAEVVIKFCDYGGRSFDHASVTVEFDGVTVEVHATTAVPPEDVAARRAAAAAAPGGEDR